MLTGNTSNACLFLVLLLWCASFCCLQPWYSALEAMRYLLPDDQAREKLAGQSWQVCALCTASCCEHACTCAPPLRPDLRQTHLQKLLCAVHLCCVCRSS